MVECVGCCVVCARARSRACVRACVCVCVRACMCLCVRDSLPTQSCRGLRFLSAYDEVCLKIGPTCAFYDTTSVRGLRKFLAYTRKHPCWDEHVCGQLHFLTHADGRGIRLDALASTEHVTETLVHLSGVLGLDPPLSHEAVGSPRNVASGRRGVGAEALDADDVRGVCELYASDYACLALPLPDSCRVDARQGGQQRGERGREEAVAVAETGGMLPDGAEWGEGGGEEAAAEGGVYPGEWHDTDVGLGAVADDMWDAATRALVDALDSHARCVLVGVLEGFVSVCLCVFVSAVIQTRTHAHAHFLTTHGQIGLRAHTLSAHHMHTRCNLSGTGPQAKGARQTACLSHQCSRDAPALVLAVGDDLDCKAGGAGVGGLANVSTWAGEHRSVVGSLEERASVVRGWVASTLVMCVDMRC